MDVPCSPAFHYRDAMAREPGVTRRDPSPVIRVGDRYHAWYSRTTHSFHGYTATLWHATSPDGQAWNEEGETLPVGGPGGWDEHAVFTPTVLVVGGRYYLFYTGVPEPFTNEDRGDGPTPTAIGMAAADSPEGPFERVGAGPVLRPADDPAAFDSLRVDDACLVVRGGRYFMYYKGRQRGNTPANTKMGLAIADHPEGPYEKHPENPLVDGGHEVCCWPHGAGVAGLFCDVGPEGNTLQYAQDGVHFERVADCTPPKAPGPYREDHFQPGTGPGIRWGLAMESADWPYLVRFDCGLTS